MHMFGPAEEAKFRYALRLSGELVDGRPGYASQCVQCGECLEKCPQQIQIPDMLAQVAAEMEGPELAERVAAARGRFSGPAEVAARVGGFLTHVVAARIIMVAFLLDDGGSLRRRPGDESPGRYQPPLRIATPLTTGRE